MSEQALSLPARAKAAIAYQGETELIAKAKESAHITAITNQDGREQVHGFLMTLKNARIEIEKRGKAAREDANAFRDAVIAEEKRLVAIVSPEEERLAALRKTWDDRIEAERQAKIKAEADRVAGIHARIAFFSKVVKSVTLRPQMTSEQIKADILDMEEIVIDDSYQEFRGNADIERADALRQLNELHAAAKTREEEFARLAAARAELDRQMAEERERQRVERERIAAEEAAAKARRDEEDRKAREALAAEQAKQRAEAGRIATEQRRERERLEAERKRLDDEEAARKAEEKRKADAAEAERLRAEREAFVPTREDIYKVLAEHYGVNEARVAVWFGQLALELTPRVDER